MPSRTIVANELATVLRQISHPDRIRLIQKLRAGDQTVNELALDLDISPTRLSQHLAVLRSEGLISARKTAQTIHYSLAPSAAVDVLRVLQTAFCPDKA